jgi:NitT/TauT family transport system substrate-binding protein
VPKLFTLRLGSVHGQNRLLTAPGAGPMIGGQESGGVRLMRVASMSELKRCGGRDVMFPLSDQNNQPDHRMARVGRWCLLLVLAMAACAPGATPSSAPAAKSAQTGPPRSITYPAVGGGILWSFAPNLIAEAKGMFAEENLAVGFVALQSSAEGCQNLIAKAADLGQCSLNDMIQVVETSGAPLIEVMALSSTSLQYTIMTKPSITSWAALKGKTVMVGGPKDNTVFFFRTMARANGLKDDDYDFQFAGASSARYAALKSGAVDATILTDPFDFQATQEGFPKLDELLPKYLNAETYSGGGPVARRDWATGHPDELTSFIRAVVKATAWVYDPKNKEELFSILGPTLNASPENLERSYQRDVVTFKAWSADGRLRESAIQGVLTSLLDLGSLKEPLPPPTKYFDMTWVDRANQPASR